MAAIAMWFGFSNLLEFLFLTALSGAVLAVALLVFRSFQMPRSKYVPAWLIQLHCVKGVPYGLALASSALALYPYTAWFSLYGR
jgi:prepilin peptidase CpaA